MIIIGDLAAPDILHCQQVSDVLTKYPQVFNRKTLVCNFEGLINVNNISINEPVLYSHPDILQSLKENGNIIACLANNHTLDLPDNFDLTINAFRKQNVQYVGAGKSLEEADKPAIFQEDGTQFVIFNACWEFLLYNHKNPNKGINVSVLNEERLIESVSIYHKKFPNACIIVFLHWNFDLETLPFPMHRQFSKDLIDEGATLVVGAHSHCVQGGERYKEGIIIYGLGNFLIANGIYANGKLVFPEMTKTELVFEWDHIAKKAICHWFDYQNTNGIYQLEYLGAEDFDTSKRLTQYSPYQQMDENCYLEFFKKNRRKNKIYIPVFQNYKHTKLNTFYVWWLKKRARFARFLAKLGIIEWKG